MNLKNNVIINKEKYYSSFYKNKFQKLNIKNLIKIVISIVYILSTQKLVFAGDEDKTYGLGKDDGKFKGLVLDQDENAVNKRIEDNENFFNDRKDILNRNNAFEKALNEKNPTTFQKDSQELMGTNRTDFQKDMDKLNGDEPLKPGWEQNNGDKSGTKVDGYQQAKSGDKIPDPIPLKSKNNSGPKYHATTNIKTKRDECIGKIKLNNLNCDKDKEITLPCSISNSDMVETASDGQNCSIKNTVSVTLNRDQCDNDHKNAVTCLEEYNKIVNQSMSQCNAYSSTHDTSPCDQLKAMLSKESKGWFDDINLKHVAFAALAGGLLGSLATLMSSSSDSKDKLSSKKTNTPSLPNGTSGSDTSANDTNKNNTNTNTTTTSNTSTDTNKGDKNDNGDKSNSTTANNNNNNNTPLQFSCSGDVRPIECDSACLNNGTPDYKCLGEKYGVSGFTGTDSNFTMRLDKDGKLFDQTSKTSANGPSGGSGGSSGGGSGNGLSSSSGSTSTTDNSKTSGEGSGSKSLDQSAIGAAFSAGRSTDSESGSEPMTFDLMDWTSDSSNNSTNSDTIVGNDKFKSGGRSLASNSDQKNAHRNSMMSKVQRGPVGDSKSVLFETMSSRSAIICNKGQTKERTDTCYIPK